MIWILITNTKRGYRIYLYQQIETSCTGDHNILFNLLTIIQKKAFLWTFVSILWCSSRLGDEILATET